jgi:hypothetical protein
MAASDRIDPIILAKYAKPLGHRFVERARSHLDRMLAPTRVRTRDYARPKFHPSQI